MSEFRHDMLSLTLCAGVGSELLILGDVILEGRSAVPKGVLEGLCGV